MLVVCYSETQADAYQKALLKPVLVKVNIVNLMPRTV